MNIESKPRKDESMKNPYPDQNVSIEDLQERAKKQRGDVEAAQKKIDSSEGAGKLAAIKEYQEATAALAVTTRWIDWIEEEERGKAGDGKTEA